MFANRRSIMSIIPIALLRSTSRRFPVGQMLSSMNESSKRKLQSNEPMNGSRKEMPPRVEKILTRLTRINAFAKFVHAGKSCHSLAYW